MALLWMWILPLFARDLHLPLGSSAIFSTKEALWIEKSKVLKAKKKGIHYLVQTKSVGRSALQQGSLRYQVFVHDAVAEHTRERLQELLPENSSLRFDWDQDQLLLRGELKDFSLWKKIAQSCDLLRCTYLQRADVPPEQIELFLQNLELERQNELLPPLAFAAQKHFALLLGAQQSEMSRIREFAAKWGLQILNMDQRIEHKTLIELQVLISEVRRSSSQSLGLLWPGEVSGQAQLDHQVFESHLPIKLRALEETGEAKILASPVLLIRSGEKGEFLAGGEIPFRIANFRTNDVIWKKFGIQLQIQAWADLTGAIELDALVEVSTPDFSQAVDGLPSLQSHRVRSHVNLLREQTLMISGLLREDRSEAKSGLSFLSRIPILGALFSSQNYLEKKSELFLWLRPRLQQGKPAPVLSKEKA